MGPTGSVVWERAMKIQEVILRTMAQRITWWQADKIRQQHHTYIGFLAEP